MHKRFRLKTLWYGLPIVLLVLLVLSQMIYDSDGPMTGAPFVDPAHETEFLESKAGRMDWDEIAAWSPKQKVARFRNHDRIYNTRTVHKGAHVFPLQASDKPLTDLHFRIWNYRRHAVIVPLYKDYDLDEFILHNNVTGLLVIKSGNIVLETYAAGNTPDTRWGSMSVTKSILSLLVGAAIEDGSINSPQDQVIEYLPELKGTSYQQVTIEQLLRMSSGVAWNLDEQDPDWKKARGMTIKELIHFLGSKNRYADPGESFNYSDAEVNLLGAAVSAAVGEDLASYLEKKIWQPFGMESDANWMTYPGGLQTGACCFSATLRDYGRLGLFAMNNGKLADGSSPLPKNWLALSTQPSKSANNYGYLWWLLDNGSYAAMGIYGQLIYINPSEDLVIAAQSAWDSATGDEYYLHQSAFIKAVTAALK
jgi:CubicO group peptidase (beta-lactamase class C family)